MVKKTMILKALSIAQPDLSLQRSRSALFYDRRLRRACVSKSGASGFARGIFDLDG